MNRAGLAISLAILAIVLYFRGPSILQHQAWAGGRETTLGHLERNDRAIVKYRAYYTVGYKYRVADKPYENEFITTRDFGVPGPVTVTYAKSDPAVSTLLPDTIDSVFRVSVIVVAAAFIPALLVVFFGLRRKSIPRSPDGR